jgi:AcrR family transcriptional regulator
MGSSKQASPPADGEDRASPVADRHLGYQQQRSFETFRKLIKAAEKLIAESSFDEASVADIAAQAGVSVGAFYRRFPNKEGLLQVVHERYTGRMCRAAAEMLDPAKWEDQSIEQILTTWSRAVVAATRRDLQLIRASARRGQDDPSFGAREQRIHAETFAGMSRLLLRHVDEIGHRQANTAVAFAVEDMSAAHYQRLIMSHLRTDHLSDAEWSRELVRSVLAYLEVRPPTSAPDAMSPKGSASSRAPRAQAARPSR